MITSMTMVDRLIGSAPFVCEGDFTDGVAQAAQIGYDGVELHIADPSAVDACRLTEALRSHDRVLTALGTGRAYVNEGLSITDPDDAKRQTAVRRVEHFIDLAGRFGAKVIIGCMRGNVPDPAELPAVLDRLSHSMRHLDRIAGDAGVTIVFEPINRYENNFLCSMAEISSFVREQSLRHTGLLIDTFHMNIEEPDLLRSIHECAPEICYVHAADSNRRYPGQGHLDFAAILRELRKVGYDGVLSAECLPWPDKYRAAEGWLRAVRTLLEKPD